MIKDIKTVNKLECKNHGGVKQIIEEGDQIKVYLKNDEILIGTLESCRDREFTLERGENDIDIFFGDIEDIEVLKRANATEAAE